LKVSAHHPFGVGRVIYLLRRVKVKIQNSTLNPMESKGSLLHAKVELEMWKTLEPNKHLNKNYKNVIINIRK